MTSASLDRTGVEIYCAPTADANLNWQSTVNHTIREGGYFVLLACQFCRRSDSPPPPEYTFFDDPSLSQDSAVAAGGGVILSLWNHPSWTKLRRRRRDHC
ncbi:hypothetical protein MLD38_004088 [Melastoma candidum]|uniref:Uncharacterized protein n=1 Tax=Melastoma candidum TaxID=119954 RepID=A0ACB9S4B2_9MYRT|nr:hypothetical protein MLD38_004088 [Melastoma candidum]